MEGKLHQSETKMNKDPQDIILIEEYTNILDQFNNI
jgi:hypothetical protein